MIDVDFKRISNKLYSLKEKAMSDEKAEVGTAQEEIIKAMGRHKERIKELENKVQVLESMIPGFQERIENLEKSFEVAFKNAQKNVEQFMKMLEDEGEPSPPLPANEEKDSTEEQPTG